MIPAEKLTGELFDIFEETFEQVHGIYLNRGTSLFETLSTISAEQASQPVSSTCASIAAQVEHVRFYLEVLEVDLQGGESGKADWDAIWQTVEAVSAEEWAVSQTRLRETYARVMAEMRAITDWNESDKLAAALHMLVHTAYHLGEIRQALCMVQLG